MISKKGYKRKYKFSIIKVGISLASIDTFTITSVDVLDKSSTVYAMELGVRPIVRLKAGVLEGSGNGANGNPWTLTQ